MPDGSGVSGPDIRLGGPATTAFALILHELSTNAVKYGALSDDAGRIDLNWRVSGEELVMVWMESGGPPVDGPPAEFGFGVRLAETSVQGELGGTIGYEWLREAFA